MNEPLLYIPAMPDWGAKASNLKKCPKCSATVFFKTAAIEIKADTKAETEVYSILTCAGCKTAFSTLDGF